jgi:Metallo-peptidase family M12B Reprolysin-like
MPLNDPPVCNGCCSLNWLALLNDVREAQMNDGNHDDVIYYGLIPSEVPRGAVGGCTTVEQSASTSAGPSGAQAFAEHIMAHEIGHFLGLSHAPCGVTVSDPNYPVYEPYPSASIGEYGLDNNDGSVFSPVAARDYMSGCPTGAWISLYNYMNLIGKELLDFQYITVIGPWDIV